MPGFTVSEFRMRPSRPWMRTSPPPVLRTISFARLVASRWVEATAPAFLAPGAFTAHLPSERRTTCRLLG